MKLSKRMNISLIITWTVIVIMIFCIWEYAQIIKNQQKDYIDNMVKTFLHTTTIPYKVYGSHAINMHFRDVDILKPYLAKPSDWDIYVNKYEDIQKIIEEFNKYVGYSKDFKTICYPFKSDKSGYVCRISFNNHLCLDISYKFSEPLGDIYIYDGIPYETFDQIIKITKKHLEILKEKIGTKYYRPKKILKYQKICDYISQSKIDL